MSDVMEFPNTVEEFMELYKVVDTEQVYTNGTEFVPIFRMKQWFEHQQAQLSAKDINVPSNGDLISKAETLKALNTWDKFACMPNGKIVPMREVDEPEMYVTYIHYADAYNCIMNMPSAQLPSYVAEIEEEYKKAVNAKWIHKPLAKALYEVWKKHDREDVSRHESN